MQKLVERFITYIKTDTQSDPKSDTTPSTDKQWNLARYLFEELKSIGLEDVTIDENAYVMATLPANVNYKVPTIGFIAHFDTSPDFSGENVNPKFVENYDGKDIILNEEKNIVLSPSYFEDLLLYKGQTIITTDGTTLLGADDKAGIAEIVTAMEYLVQHPEIKHGTIRVGFTPDEEIGRGAHKFDVQKFGADWAYTMDGSQVGELEYESFNAAAAQVHFKGKSVHPGYAKNKMVNSLLIANKFISMLPANEIPQETSGREGFYHVTDVSGDIENTNVQLIIRDHDRKLFEKRKEIVKQIVGELNKIYPNAVSVEIKDQYFNMREKIEPMFHIVEVAEKAMKELGITPIIKPIRGGTDGSQLSFMGLPCPNIFAGGHNFHGKFEYVPVESLEKATKVIVKIAELVAKK
ncbi:MAG: peptidase T [Capnocytophaga sp.]|nr:peptidase T [Capnocytophaga sp.]